MILFTMLLTAVIETTFFYLCRYRNLKLLGYIFGINLFTNFIVNQIFAILYYTVSPLWFLMLILEISVLFSEFFLLGLWCRKWTGKLFLLLLIANFITWGCGMFLFW